MILKSSFLNEKLSPGSKSARQRIKGRRESFLSARPSFYAKNKPKVRISIFERMTPDRRRQLVRHILLVLTKVKKCGLKRKDLENRDIFPIREFTHPKSRSFFSSIQQNDISEVKTLLKEHPKLVFQIDMVF